jgi:hypothetical protein
MANKHALKLALRPIFVAFTSADATRRATCRCWSPREKQDAVVVLVATQA